jgi:hypothetical protein
VRAEFNWSISSGAFMMNNLAERELRPIEGSFFFDKERFIT